MITIGVTGGIGAGKSEILRYLNKSCNCRIIMSDNAAKMLEQPGGPLYEPLIELLSEKEASGGQQGELLTADGEIDKKEMAARIFGDPDLLRRINELVHPAVNRYILDEIERERITGEREFFTPVRGKDGTVIGYFERHEKPWDADSAKEPIGDYWKKD